MLDRVSTASTRVSPESECLRVFIINTCIIKVLYYTFIITHLLIKKQNYEK